MLYKDRPLTRVLQENRLLDHRDLRGHLDIQEEATMDSLDLQDLQDHLDHPCLDLTGARRVSHVKKKKKRMYIFKIMAHPQRSCLSGEGGTYFSRFVHPDSKWVFLQKQCFGKYG